MQIPKFAWYLQKIKNFIELYNNDENESLPYNNNK